MMNVCVCVLCSKSLTKRKIFHNLLGNWKEPNFYGPAGESKRGGGITAKNG